MSTPAEVAVVAFVVPAVTPDAAPAVFTSEDAVSAPAPAPAPDIAPAPEVMTMRATFVVSAWRDLKRFMWLVMLGLTVLSCYHTVRLRFFDPKDFYAYQGTVGPYEVLVDDGGHTDPGPPLTVAHPGQQFGWMVSFCLNEGVSVVGSFDLVRLAQQGFPESIVAHKQGVVGPAAHRCGPLFNTWKVPEGALPGAYEVRRRVIMRHDTWLTFSQAFPAVPLAVLPAPPPAPAAPPVPDRSSYKRIGI